MAKETPKKDHPDIITRHFVPTKFKNSIKLKGGEIIKVNVKIGPLIF